MMKKILYILLLLPIPLMAIDSQFDELDKVPEGAHEGQMLLVGYTAMGTIFGDMKNSEDNFLFGSTYTFIESDVTKMLMVNYLTFKFGVTFEYMPIDHLGVLISLNNNKIIERTIFGSQYQNWSSTLLNEYSALLGASYHLTNRKPWDLTATLWGGYSMGKFSPSPIGKILLTSFSGESQKSTSAFIVGGELNFIGYFSRGTMFSLGGGWFYHILSTDAVILQTNPVTTKPYSSSLAQPFHDISIKLAVGYAFSN